MTKMALFDAQNGSFSAHMWLYLEILLNVKRYFKGVYGSCVWNKLYPNGFGKFKCEQGKAIELGDEYGEFVVTKL